MEKVIRYQCQHCGKEFKTSNRHHCKKNPALKNCFTCKHLKGWNNDNAGTIFETPGPDCTACNNGDLEWNLGIIKDSNYDMQCDFWEEGKYDWISEYKRDIDLFLNQLK